MSLIYRGTSSDDVKFNVTERRVYNAPAFDVTGIEVPGRSGDILNSQERFKNKAIVYTGFIRSSDFPGDTTWGRLSRGLRTIKAWICGDAGKYHDLTDDYDPGFVRRAFVSGETAISEVLDRPDGATITITFMAEPFMYEESDPIELPETGTASGAIASFEGVAAPLQSLKFNIEPSQSGSGDPSPSNIRPISGWSQVDGKQSGEDMTDYTPITISLGQTVYGGTVDAIAGKLNGDYGLFNFTRSQSVTDNIASQNRIYFKLNAMESGTYLNDPMVICNSLPKHTPESSGTTEPNIAIGANSQYVYIQGITLIPGVTDLASFRNWLDNNPITFTYKLATPIEVDLTPVSVSSLLGQNNIWCNTGDTEVVYVEPTENPTEWPSKPRLEITMAGAGTLTVNGKTWSIGAYTGTLICDSEIMDWYDASNLKNSLVSGDGFPEFQPGENVITYTGGITKVVAKPRWRTL